ncbi:MAG: energy transducer TonB [Bacteroidia bacterium]
MKVLGGLLFWVFIASLSYGQKTKKVHKGDRLGIYEKYYVMASDHSIKHGTYEKYDNRRLIETGEYKEGERIGEWFFYKYDKVIKRNIYSKDSLISITRNGSIIKKTSFLSSNPNVKNGPYTERIDNLITVRGEYLNGYKNGNWINNSNRDFRIETEFLNGSLVKQTIYCDSLQPFEIKYSNGLKQGTVKIKYANNGLKHVMYYENGLLNGVKECYEKNGNLLWSINYENGIKDGIEKKYHSNGKVAQVCEYKSGKLNGNQRKFNENEELVLETIFVDGVFKKVLSAFGYEDGEKIAYVKDGNGKLNLEIGARSEFYNLSFENGYLNGEQKILNAVSGYSIIENYNDGELNGLITTKDKSDKLLMQGKVQDSIKIGLWKLYSSGVDSIIEVEFKPDHKKGYMPKVRLNELFIVEPYLPQSTEPSFPNGKMAYYKHLRTYLVYPKIERENSIEGTSYIEFIVYEDGTIEGLRITEGLEMKATKNMHFEAMEIVNKMPSWTPSTEDLIPSRNTVHLPIRFKLR